MKKLIYILMIIPVLWSCEELENQQPYSGSDVLKAGSGEYTISEAGEVLRIPISSTRPGIEYSFSFSGTAEQDIDFTLTGATSRTLGADVYYDTITITAIDNLIADGEKSVSVTLTTSASGVEVGYPNDVEGLGAPTVIINDDDCALGFDYSGAWTYVDATGIDGFPGSLLCVNFAFCTGAGATVDIAVDPSDPSGNTGIITGGPFGSPYTINFVTCNEELVATGSTTSFAGVGVWNMQQGATGTGTYSASRLTIVGVLGTNGDFEMEFTR